MRATSFVDSTAKTGLDKPRLTVYVKFDDGKKEERVDVRKGRRRRLRCRAGRSRAPRRSAAAEFDEVIKTLDEITK